MYALHCKIYAWLETNSMTSMVHWATCVHLLCVLYDVDKKILTQDLENNEKSKWSLTVVRIYGVWMLLNTTYSIKQNG